MFSLFKIKPTQSFNDFSFIGTDIHSHLLPGVDDGSTNTEESIELIEGLKELGFNSIITTSHVMVGHYPNTSDKLKLVGEKLKKILNKINLNIGFNYSAEYYLDEHFETLLKSQDIIPMPGNHLLFELSFVAPPPQLEEVVFQLKIKKYKPILAHPERYLYWSNNFHKYERLKDMGCIFQLNLLSVLGLYGKDVEKNAKKMLKAGMFELAGSDVHNLEQIKMLKQGLEAGKFYLLNDYPFKNKQIFAAQTITT